MASTAPVLSKHDAETSGVMADATALLRKLAAAHPGDFVAIKQAAKDCVHRLDEARDAMRSQQRHRLAPERSVDAWILDMFTATESAISREQLVADFVQRYRRERNVRDHDRHAGPWLLDLAYNPAQGETEPLLLAAAGVHPAAVAPLAQEWLPQWKADPYLASVFGERQDIDAWHPIWFGASPLFDGLVQTGARAGQEPDYFVNAVALPGHDRQGVRGVFVLHPNGGTPEDPRPPPNMKQDQRLLVVLALAWRQLEHQLKSLARLAEADRRAMIQLLAPGVLHHEIGSVMNTLASQVAGLGHQLKELADLNPEVPDFAVHAQLAAAIHANTQRIYAVTDAFNNLDRRAAVETTSLGHVCQGVRDLLKHRLGHIGVDLRWPEAEFDALELRTDAVLLSQALLNICSNALNAFDESDRPAPRMIRVSVGAAEALRVTLIIANNGPPIDAATGTHIFERGYTTRPQGHGQGLYLSRLIAHYLGGELQLMEAARVPAPHTVAFRLSLLKDQAAVQGLARVG